MSEPASAPSQEHGQERTDDFPWHSLLLQLRDQLFLSVQLVSKAADLLLVDLSVRLDLLLYSILSQQGQWHWCLQCCSSKGCTSMNSVLCCICFLVFFNMYPCFMDGSPPGMESSMYSTHPVPACILSTVKHSLNIFLLLFVLNVLFLLLILFVHDLKLVLHWNGLQPSPSFLSDQVQTSAFNRDPSFLC